MKLTAAVLSLAAKLLSGATVRWFECQPDTCQRVYFANHTSHLDALILWASLPRRIRELTRPVAAKDYWNKGPLRRYMAELGLTPASRSQVAAYDATSSEPTVARVEFVTVYESKDGQRIEAPRVGSKPAKPPDDAADDVTCRPQYLLGARR